MMGNLGIDVLSHGNQGINDGDPQPAQNEADDDKTEGDHQQSLADGRQSRIAGRRLPLVMVIADSIAPVMLPNDPQGQSRAIQDNSQADQSQNPVNKMQQEGSQDAGRGGGC